MKTAIILAIIGFAIVYGLTNSIDKLQDEVNHENTKLSLENNGKEGEFSNNIAQLFPDFEEMKYFVENEVSDETTQKRVLKEIEKIQEEYIGGSISSQEVITKLSKVKK